MQYPKMKSSLKTLARQPMMKMIIFFLFSVPTLESYFDNQIIPIKDLLFELVQFGLDCIRTMLYSADNNSKVNTNYEFFL